MLNIMNQSPIHLRIQKKGFSKSWLLKQKQRKCNECSYEKKKGESQNIPTQFYNNNSSINISFCLWLLHLVLVILPFHFSILFHNKSIPGFDAFRRIENRFQKYPNAQVRKNNLPLPNLMMENNIPFGQLRPYFQESTGRLIFVAQYAVTLYDF